MYKRRGPHSVEYVQRTRLDTKNGQAWISLNLCLGNPPSPPQACPSPPAPPSSRNTPSRQNRRARRQAARTAVAPTDPSQVAAAQVVSQPPPVDADAAVQAGPSDPEQGEQHCQNVATQTLDFPEYVPDALCLDSEFLAAENAVNTDKHYLPPVAIIQLDGHSDNSMMNLPSLLVNMSTHLLFILMFNISV